MEGRNDDCNAEQRTQYRGCSRQTALEDWHGKAALAVQPENIYIYIYIYINSAEINIFWELK
jgi:hypothetical protein